MDPRLVADVRVTTQRERTTGGSGYLVGPTLVLTAAHVLKDWKIIRVRLGVDPPAPAVKGEVCWEDKDLDVALVRLRERQSPPVARWGRVSGTDPREYQVLGYPDLALGDGGRRDVQHVEGTLHPLDGIVTGELRLGPRGEFHAPEPWEGFSGTAVFVRGRLVGVVIAHDAGSRRLHARHTVRFASDPDFARLVREDTGRWPRTTPLFSPRRVVALVGTLAVLVVAGVAVVPLAPSGCAPPLEFGVLTTADQYEVIQRAAADFTVQRGREEDGCLPVRVSVTAVGDADRARELLGTGWADLRVGPRPHVWLPDSTADVALLRYGDEARDAPGLTARGSTRRTPVVLGLPASAEDIPACSGTVPDRPRSNLAECAAAAGEAGLRLARPAPGASASALIQTDVLYSAHGGPRRAEAIQLAEAGAASAGIEAGGNLALLCALRDGDLDQSTVAVFSTEHAIHDHNNGEALGPGCGRSSEPPAEQLVPVYFADAPDLDHPFVRLDWGDDDGVHHEVRAFERWMLDTAGAGSRAFDGYRAPDGRGLGEDDSLLGREAAPVTTELAQRQWRDQLADTLGQQERSRAPIEALVVLDRSDSMRGPGTEGTRLDTAQHMAADVVGLLGEQDAVGLWAFPEDGSGDDATGQERLVLPEPGLDQARAEEVIAQVDALAADLPATPLADAIRDGAEELGSCPGPSGGIGACALIVFTDGVALPEPRGGADQDEVAGALDGLDARVRVHLVAVGNEGCGGDELLSRMARAGAQCHHPRGDELDRVVHEIVAGTRAVSD